MHVPNSSKGSYRLLSNPISPENELFQAQKYATIGLLSRCSSVVEQLFCKQQVAGSIPLTGSILMCQFLRDMNPLLLTNYGLEISV